MRWTVVVGMVAVAMMSGAWAGAVGEGDMNCDGVVDSADCPVMYLAMTDPAGYVATYPNCPIDHADMNSDGLTDCVDFPLFTDLVAQTSPGGCGFMDCPLQPGSVFAIGDEPTSDAYVDVACDDGSWVCLAVWVAASGDETSIWGRTFGIDGVAFGEPFQISAAVTRHHDPRVACDPVRHRFLVVWSAEYSPDPIDYDIWGRLVPAGGVDPGLPPFPVSLSTTHQESPDVAYAPGADEFLVLWSAVEPSTWWWIGGRRTLADGSGFATGDLAVLQDSLGRRRPLVVWDDDNLRYVVAYLRFDEAPDPDIDVWLSRISWSGAQIGVETGIAGWPGDEMLADLAVLRGAPVVLWTAGTAYARWAGADGLPTGPPLDLGAGIAAGSPNRSVVACEGTGAGCRVVFELVSPSQVDLVQRSIAATGMLGEVEELRVAPPGHPAWSTFPAMTSSSGRFVVTWSQDLPNRPDDDIHGRILLAGIFSDGFESGNTGLWSATAP